MSNQKQLVSLKSIKLFMKALMKGNAPTFLKKPDKAIDNKEAIMDSITQKQLAKQIGISQDQIEYFAPFFEQIHKMQLPPNFTRHLNQDKTKVIYRNLVDETESDVHPSLHLLKTLFYKIIANNKAVYTFDAKGRKLLPFVQEKMMRQIIAIQSKRRDVQKVNLQRDQNGKMVLSKLARIKPDIKPLITSRSYLLKMLVEKIYTKKQIWGRGKRANLYSTLLANYHSKLKHSQPEREEQEENNQIELQTYQSIFKMACEFYEQQFGDVDGIPLSVQNSRDYLKGTPDNVIKNIHILNINKNNVELFWLARMMDCLPLPSHWAKRMGSAYSQYIYQPMDLTFQIHPSYIYVMKQMNRFRTNFQKMDQMLKSYYTQMQQMTFFDYFQRSYSVDLFSLINKQQESASKAQKKKKRPKRGGQMVKSDWMYLEGFLNYRIPPHAYPALEAIQDFWLSKNFDEQTYYPSISPFGQVSWSSNITARCIDYCPFQQQIAVHLQKSVENLPEIHEDDLKPEIKQLSEQQYQFFIEQMPRQRQNFALYYIKRIQMPTALIWPYEVEKTQTYFQNYFISPFNLESKISGINQQLPLWLQKVHAKRSIVIYENALKKSEENFAVVLKKVVEYALQMGRIHQPLRMEQIQSKISKINTIKHLVDFIIETYDIDQRQQRKRLLLQKDDDAQSDDIFGSSISNIDIQNRKDQDQQKKQQQSESSESAQSSQELKQEVAINIQFSSESEKSHVSQISEEKSQQYQQSGEEQQRVPFEHIIEKKKYSKDLILEDKTEAALDKYLKKIYKQNIKKHKFSQRQVKYQKFQIKTNNEGIRRIVKQNLIVTRNNSPNVPYRNLDTLRAKVIRKKQGNQNIQKVKKNRTVIVHPDVTVSYDQFNSSMNSYSNEEIHEEIEFIKRSTQKQLIKNQQSWIDENPEKFDHNETNNTIILEPIKRIKPNLYEDPILKHISNVGEDLDIFRKTFTIQNKSTSLNKTQKQTFRTQINPTIKKNNSLTKFSSTLYSKSNLQSHVSQSQLTLHKKLEPLESFNNKQTLFQGTYNRVCLDKTANHFLSTGAVLKKGQLVTLQARKSLLSKGRGLSTFISKKY